ncbi:hypothetical protein GGD70_007799, partial [Paraburkholderia fungorum]|nr:hypothetical protein [Paraburkholderia fungorum]
MRIAVGIASCTMICLRIRCVDGRCTIQSKSLHDGLRQQRNDRAVQL